MNLFGEDELGCRNGGLWVLKLVSAAEVGMKIFSSSTAKLIFLLRDDEVKH